MKLSQIKETLKVIALDFTRSKTEAGEATEWLRYWDNKNRVAVSAHQDVIQHIKDTPDTTKLALKYEAKTTKTGDMAGMVYDNYILIKADSIEDSL
jgi:hypothetical protein